MTWPTTLWAYAFRPFFLAASGYGICLTLAWAAVLLLGLDLRAPMAGGQWHAHEMLIGFVGAALAGFLLTAVPSWTATPPVTGRPLALLAALWLAGRLTMWAAGWLPLALTATVNLAFLVVLAGHVAGPILGDRQRRHVSFLLVLALLWAAQAVCHWGWWIDDGALAGRGLDALVSLYVLLIVLTLGRIGMVVVNAALDEVGEPRRFRPHPARGTMAWATVALYGGAEFAAPDSAVTGWIALAAAAAQLDRLTDWHVGRAVLRPYVLILYAGCWWIVLGLAGIGAHHVWGAVPESLGRHALTVGAIGSAILAVFVIAGMRHTGRPLEVPPLGGLAFALLSAAAVARVLAPIWQPSMGMGLASLLFVAALAAYLVAFVPKLLKPRVDGEPG